MRSLFWTNQWGIKNIFFLAQKFYRLIQVQSNFKYFSGQGVNQSPTGIEARDIIKKETSASRKKQIDSPQRSVDSQDSGYYDDEPAWQEVRKTKQRETGRRKESALREKENLRQTYDRRCYIHGFPSTSVDLANFFTSRGWNVTTTEVVLEEDSKRS